MQTTVNGAYIEEVKWVIKLTENELGARAGLSPGYIYRLLDSENAPDVKLSTVDRLHDAIAARMVELGQNPPDDLWERLIRHDFGA